MNIFVGRLKKLQLAHHMQQKDMAEKIGVPLRTYQRYEYGEREPLVKVLIGLANCFDVSVDYLLGLTDNPMRNK